MVHMQDNKLWGNPRGKNGRKLLHLAAENGKGDICQLVLNQIEDKNPKDDHGVTPSDLAKECGDYNVCNIFRSYGFK